MPDQPNAAADACEPAIYQITVEGHLGRHWEGWFEGLTITTDADGNTRITGHVVDQAALFGLLRKVRDLGKPLLAVSRIRAE
ncbi:MAG: hypothetical protein JXC32_17120 [Anaerolineae bacterium]|nr:hypothetical protein [Anaerolineae bacterium]